MSLGGDDRGFSRRFPDADRIRILRPVAWAVTLSASDLRKVLSAGGLPSNEDAVELLRTGLADIADRNTAWPVIMRRLSDRAMSRRLKRITGATVRLSTLLADDPGRRIEAFLSPAWPDQAEIDLDTLRAAHAALVAKAAFYETIFSNNTHKPVRRTEPENWLFRELFKLATKIKGQPLRVGRPSGPFARFVVGSAKLLDIKLSPPSEDALHKRLQRLAPYT
jgi:hypothetical protein